METIHLISAELNQTTYVSIEVNEYSATVPVFCIHGALASLDYGEYWGAS